MRWQNISEFSSSERATGTEQQKSHSQKTIPKKDTHTECKISMRTIYIKQDEHASATFFLSFECFSFCYAHATHTINTTLKHFFKTFTLKFKYYQQKKRNKDRRSKTLKLISQGIIADRSFIVFLLNQFPFLITEAFVYFFPCRSNCKYICSMKEGFL